jgi:hypothetical protein
MSPCSWISDGGDDFLSLILARAAKRRQLQVSPVRRGHSGRPSVFACCPIQSQRSSVAGWCPPPRFRSYSQGVARRDFTARWSRLAGTTSAAVTRFGSGESGLDAADARQDAGKRGPRHRSGSDRPTLWNIKRGPRRTAPMRWWHVRSGLQRRNMAKASNAKSLDRNLGPNHNVPSPLPRPRGISPRFSTCISPSLEHFFQLLFPFY